MDIQLLRKFFQTIYESTEKLIKVPSNFLTIIPLISVVVLINFLRI